jgi:hypothetical protein
MMQARDLDTNSFRILMERRTRSSAFIRRGKVVRNVCIVLELVHSLI